MGMIYTAVLISVSASGELTANPSIEQVKSASSLHVLAFSSKGNLLLNESQGEFDFQTWDKIHDLAETICRGSPAGWVGKNEDVTMGEAGAAAKGQPLEQFIRETVEDKIREEFMWKLAAP